MKFELFINTYCDFVFIFNSNYFADESWYYDFNRECFEQTVDCDYQPKQNYKRLRKVFK